MIKVDFNPPLSQLRQFGWIATFAFPVIAFVITWRFLAWDPNHWSIYTIGAVWAYSVLMTLAFVPGLRPVYVTLMVVAMPIGFVISWVMMVLLYYGLFTPLAVVFRLMGRDTMHRRIEPAASTYWSDHRDIANPRSPASYFRLY